MMSATMEIAEVRAREARSFRRQRGRMTTTEKRAITTALLAITSEG